MINQERLWDSLMTMAEIGATAGGGVGRLALTDLDRQARDLFRGWCEDAGCAIRIDRLGNIFARRAGTDAGAPWLVGGEGQSGERRMVPRVMLSPSSNSTVWASNPSWATFTV